MEDFKFENTDQINGLLDRADDREETIQLINRFSHLKETRNPFHLDAEDFEKVIQWKLRGQYGRQKSLRKTNTPEIIEIVTRAAFSIQHPDKDREVVFRVKYSRH